MTTAADGEGLEEEGATSCPFPLSLPSLVVCPFPLGLEIRVVFLIKIDV